MSDEAIREKLKKQQYGLIGKYSAIKVCEWQKKDLRGEGACYKSKFYGVPTHRCIQLSTTLNFCDNMCTYCWRDMADTKGNVMPDCDDPAFVVEEALKQQQKMLMGFKGNPKVSKEKFAETEIPAHFAISLTGEPTLYPKLPELIEETKKLHCSSFVVTNGLHVDVLKKIKPTQLYISLDATNKDDFFRITACKFKDGWDRLLESLDYISTLTDVRTVLRITVIKSKNMRDSDKQGFADLIKRANPKFVEVKSFMHIGSSQSRLEVKDQLYFDELSEFAKEIGALCGYSVVDEHAQSKVLLLAKDGADLSDKLIDYSSL